VGAEPFKSLLLRQKNKTDLVSVLFFLLKKRGIELYRDGYPARANEKKHHGVMFFRSEGAKVRVSRAEQAQAIARDTRREWGRSPSNLSFSAKKFDKFRLVEFFYPLRKQWYIITMQSWISSPKVYIISRRLYLLSQ
jgi:hypothetical protein